MAKDTKGHGSEKRGAAVQNYADVMKRNPGYGNLRAKGEALAAVHPDDKSAALALANAHPKSDPVPVHDAMSKQYFPNMSPADKQASRDRNSADTRDEYNRDLSLRSRNGQVGSGMKFRG